MKHSPCDKHYLLAAYFSLCFSIFPSTIQPATPVQDGDQTNGLAAQEYFDLAQAYFDKKEKDKAAIYYEKTLEKNPDHVETHLRLGNIKREKELFDLALKHFAHVVKLQPTNLIALMELGNTFNILDRDEESITFYMRALELKPDLTSALHNFAFTLKKMGRCQDAIQVFKKLLQLTPNYALAHFNLSAALLSTGNFKEGWEEYEWRWQAYNETPKRFTQPLWNGADISGKKILVYAEQGLGDTLQFIRYAQVLKQKGAYVIIETQAALAPLLRLCPYIDHVVVRNEALPDFDYQIAMMSLPHVLGTTPETVPNELPYLFADPKLVATWKEKLSADKNFKIGICWHGNGRYPTQALRHAVEAKAIPLKKLAELTKLGNVSLYSLQRFDGTDQIAFLDKSTPIHQFPADFDVANGRFMDTAAVMKNLDLVLTIDTSVAHLAGALNVNTWLLLPDPADWRWIIGRDDSPWYPGMRLFKQQKRGDWDGLLETVAQELRKIVTQRAPTPTPAPVLDKNTGRPATVENNIAHILEFLLTTPALPSAPAAPTQPAAAVAPAQTEQPIRVPAALLASTPTQAAAPSQPTAAAVQTPEQPTRVPEPSVTPKPATKTSPPINELVKQKIREELDRYKQTLHT